VNVEVGIGGPRSGDARAFSKTECSDGTVFSATMAPENGDDSSRDGGSETGCVETAGAWSCMHVEAGGQPPCSPGCSAPL
jgi:hypothetical protein